ncbi:MAG: metalloregulator ArsR/SmtB family transcription factor [Defluviitaleaceae bacterium]|nr:metalloregulator ArsR/SmtB family transcription factor [Defluviitaleaceae bacterium]MCL2263809.1 metalloregulator ArsR/SmtB family transcription factor [Defluviitaleaceae bacterium]
MKSNNVLHLFKCLADASRLSILKSLNREDMYVEQLAERLNLSSATISSHMKKLEEIGAVQSRKEQYYSMYSLCPDTFSHNILDLIQCEEHDSVGDERESEYRKKILSTFMPKGKITKMPAQLKKKLILIEEICRSFDKGVPYTEKEVNHKIIDFYDDFCMVRRFFVDYGLFARERDVYFKQCDKISTLQMPHAH